MLSLTGLNQKSTYGLMVKRLRRCPLTAESAVRFRMGLPKKRRQRLLASFFCSPCKERTRQRSCRRSYSRQRILPRGSRLRETANSANDYKQKVFGTYAATCCRRSYSRQRILPRGSRMRETANSAWGYGMITKSFWSPRGKRGLPSFVFASANLAEGLTHAGNGKFRK